MKIQSVGIKDIQLPVRIREKSGRLQNNVATVSLQVSMPGEYRESCVHTFASVLNKYMDDLSVSNFPDLLAEVKEGLGAESARVEMSFPYFIEKQAPVSGTRSLMEYECSFTGEVAADNDFILSVKVPICPLKLLQKSPPPFCQALKRLENSSHRSKRHNIIVIIREQIVA